jgi:hypothetical protein
MPKEESAAQSPRESRHRHAAHQRDARRRRTVNVVRDRLLARGLPARRAVRYARELQAHWEDVRDELLAAGRPRADAEAEADRRLGGAGELVAAAVRAHRADSFAGRHPLLCLVLVPFVLVPLLPVLVTAAVVLPLSSSSADDGGAGTVGGPPLVHNREAAEVARVYAAACAATYLLPAALAVAVTRLARRRTLSSRWACAACAAVALSAGLQSVRLWTARGERPTHLAVNYGLPPDPGRLCFVAAAAAGSAWLVRRRGSRPEAALAYS